MCFQCQYSVLLKQILTIFFAIPCLKPFSNRFDGQFVYLHIRRRLNAIGNRIGHILRTQHWHFGQLLRGVFIEDFSINNPRTNALQSKCKWD